jgi:hypothetical protein
MRTGGRGTARPDGMVTISDPAPSDWTGPGLSDWTGPGL